MAQDTNWLFDQLRNVQSALVAERIVLDANAVRSQVIRIQAQALTDPTEQQTALAALDAWDANQSRLEAGFSAWSQAWSAALADARGWLAQMGGALPSDLGSLGSLGVPVWIVPVVLATAVILAVTYAITVHDVNTKQTAAITAYEQTMQDLMDKNATAAQLAAVANGYNGASKAAMDGAPNIFGGLGTTITTLVWVAAAAMLLPTIVGLFKKVRT